jgi:RHS repeat-associated protein
MRSTGSSGAKHFFHRNQQYSITALTDASGTIVERYAYTAYGTPTITDASGTPRTTTAIGNRYTYTGREWDETLALYHYRARMYDAVGGRFVSRDPIGYTSKETNVYRFIGGMPLKYVDPLGLDRFTDMWPEDADNIAVNLQFAALIDADCDGLSIEEVWVEAGGISTIGVVTWVVEISNPQITELRRESWCSRNVWKVRYEGSVEVLLKARMVVGIYTIGLNLQNVTRLITFPFSAGIFKCGDCPCNYPTYRHPLVEVLDPETRQTTYSYLD